jgi:hypothetical protein
MKVPSLAFGAGGGSAAATGLFMVAAAESFNIFSAMNSSPWTAENFGADPEKARSCRQYVLISIVANEGLGLGASMLASNWWPLLGTTVVSLFMWWLYWRALQKGLARNSMGWSNP